MAAGFEEPEAEGLTEEHKKEIRKVIKRLQAILPMLKAPIDPNVYPLIDTSINILEIQCDLDIHHVYDDDIVEDASSSDEDVKEATKVVKKELDKPKKKAAPIIPSSGIPSPEDLEDWFGQEGPDIE